MPEYATHNTTYAQPAVHKPYQPPPTAHLHNPNARYRQDSSEYGDDEGYAGHIDYYDEEQPPPEGNYYAYAR